MTTVEQVEIARLQWQNALKSKDKKLIKFYFQEYVNLYEKAKM